MKKSKSKLDRYNFMISWYKSLKIWKNWFIYRFLGIVQYNMIAVQMSLEYEHTLRGHKEEIYLKFGVRF